MPKYLQDILNKSWAKAFKDYIFPQINDENEFISKLLDEKIYNIITSEEIAEMKNEILKCISDEGKTKGDWISLREITLESEGNLKNQYIFNHKNIKIAVA